MKNQQGIGLLSFVIIVGVAMVLGTMAIRLAPLYVDYWSLSRVISDVAEESKGAEVTPAQIRQKLSRRFITNRIESISLRDIKIKNNDNGVLIDATYEKRVPLFINIDAVVKFEDALFQVER
jgi:hypothetical protein